MVPEMNNGFVSDRRLLYGWSATERGCCYRAEGEEVKEACESVSLRLGLEHDSGACDGGVSINAARAARSWRSCLNYQIQATRGFPDALCADVTV